MSSAGARAEAERRWPLWLPTGDPEIDAEGYSELDAKWQNEDTERDRAHFVQGAEWQAERDAERIRDLEAEGASITANRDEWASLMMEIATAEPRAKAAEAKLAAVREFAQCQHDEIRGRYDRTGGAPAEYVGFANACGDILAVLDGAETT